MDVSIIIVNYNTKDLTNQCINSIIEKTEGVEFEIILVDNASSDGSKEYFGKDDRITYIYSEKNGGFGYGNNRGMEVAKGKYFFLLNSDTYLKNNAIREFFDYAESHEKRAIYGCYLEDANGNYARSFFDFPAFTIKDFLKRTFGLRKKVDVNYKNQEVDCVSGANIFIPRLAIIDCGGFDENIFLYGEEGELQYRCKNKNYKRNIINTPHIVHLEGQSSKESIWKKSIILKSHFYILKKHMTYPTYILARFYYALNIGIRHFWWINNNEGREYLKILFTPVLSTNNNTPFLST